MNPIDSAIERHPSNVAFDDGIKQIQYRELSPLLAHSPVGQASGLSAGDYLAWVPNNDVDAYLTFWAIQKRNGVACPISSRLSRQSQQEMVDQIGAKWLPEWLSQPHVTVAKPEQDIKREHQLPSTLIFSSGSTGVPKAIVHSMSAHIASALGAADNIPLNPGDRWYWSLPLCHISGLSILVRCAVAGATVVGASKDEKLTATTLHTHEVTHLSVVSTQLRRLLSDRNFPSPFLRTVLLGGSAVDPQLVIAARERGVDVRTTYGLSEMASQVTTSGPAGDSKASGKILPNRELRIDSNNEILVRGQTLCLGYLRNGRVESIVDEQGWFHTNDLGTLNGDSELVVKGRIDNMFVSGGENIHPENIEKAMLTLFELEQVLVVPKQDSEFGARPVAFVDGNLPSDWKNRLSELLPRFELPIEILDWPADLDSDIKPNRSFFQRLISS